MVWILTGGVLLVGILWPHFQKEHALLRIYGWPAAIRWAAESVRSKLTQYLERQGDGRPFPLVKRDWAYRASKGLPTVESFGTHKDLHQVGTHTIRPAPFGFTSVEIPNDSFRVLVGRGKRKFKALFPVMRSGGSFGAFGAHWTRAASDGGALLNKTCQRYDMSGFLDNTGEGGLSPHHLSVSRENQDYLDRLNERAGELGHSYQFRFDRTATSDGKIIEVPLDLKLGSIGEDGRYVCGHSGVGASEFPRNVIVQIGPSLSGFRTPSGDIDWEWLDYVCGLPDVVGVEIKGQQGAKPNDGGTVKKEKLTAELRALRGFHGNSDYISPERLPFIRSPDYPLTLQVEDLIRVFRQIQNLPNVVRRGLITGYKMTYCGDEFLGALSSFLVNGDGPDYLVVDGAEGGTGAADPVLTDHVGVHTFQGIYLTHRKLVAEGVRDKVRLVASGRILDPGDVATVMCLGADYCNTLRGFMFSTGCIQATECHSGKCPTGITTHHSWRLRGFDPTLKAARFANYGLALRDKLVKLARVAGVDLLAGDKFDLYNLEVVSGVGRLSRGDAVYPMPENPK